MYLSDVYHDNNVVFADSEKYKQRSKILHISLIQSKTLYQEKLYEKNKKPTRSGNQ